MIALAIALVGCIAGAVGTGVGLWIRNKNSKETERHNQAEEELEEAKLEQNAELQREQEIADYETQLALQQQQQQYDEYMSSTELQRQVADAQAAGINLNTLAGSGASNALGTGGSTLKPNNITANSGKPMDATNITNALALESMAYTAAHHPNEFYRNIYKMGHEESRATIEQIKEQAKQEKENLA